MNFKNILSISFFLTCSMMIVTSSRAFHEFDKEGRPLLPIHTLKKAVTDGEVVLENGKRYVTRHTAEFHDDLFNIQDKFTLDSKVSGVLHPHGICAFTQNIVHNNGTSISPLFIVWLYPATHLEEFPNERVVQVDTLKFGKIDVIKYVK